MITTYRVKNITEKKNIDGFKTIQVLSWHRKNTPYYELSPYLLKTDGNEENINSGNVIFENFWQFSKLYKTVYDIKVYPHFTKNGNPNYLQWKWPTETHVENSVISWPTYLNWRYSGFDCQHPIRRPNGNKAHECLCTILGKSDNSCEYLDYIEARKRIYVKEYCRLIRKLPIYAKLLNMVRSGTNICIQEIDVPAANKKGFYGSLCRSDGVYIANLNSLEQLLNDPSEAFGHGLCLCIALLEDLHYT